MYFVVLLKVAIYSLVANKLRSFLAVLGIIIGVGAVIAMLAIGAGAKAQVLSSISAMGSNLLVVRPGQHGPGGVMTGTQQNLTVEDAQAILAEVPGVGRVAPVVLGRAQLKYFENNSGASVIGSSGRPCIRTPGKPVPPTLQQVPEMVTEPAFGITVRLKALLAV